MNRQQASWDEITRKGGEPFTVFSQAARDLDRQGLVLPDKEQCLVALFLDFVPIDEIGAVAQAIEEGVE